MIWDNIIPKRAPSMTEPEVSAENVEIVLIFLCKCAIIEEEGAFCSLAA